MAVSQSTSHALPVIRWAGSKRKLLKKLRLSAPSEYGTYIEPFAGSAALFFSLRPQNAILNDLNPELISFYVTMRHRPRDVYRKALSISQTKASYLKTRALDPKKLSAIDRAARFFYLNRLCFNGLYRTNKCGGFNVPMGVKTGRFPTEEEFVCTAKALRKAKLVNGDFQDVLNQSKSGDFVYLDPPYYTPESRKRNEYGNNCFTSSDLPRLIKCLTKLHKKKVHFLLSYSFSRQVITALDSFRIRQMKVHRCISGFSTHRKKATEIMISNASLLGSA